MNRIVYSLIALGMSGLAACDITDNEVEPGLSFARIYDDRSFAADYDPLDVAQTEDGGYLSLAATNAWNIYLFQTDADGQFVWENKVDEAYVNPLEKLVRLGNQHYVFAMNEVTLATVVIPAGPGNNADSSFTEISEVQYPLDVAVTPDESLLILGYNRESHSSTLHKLDTDFNVIWSEEYSVEEDMEEEVIRHLSRTGRRLPFFVGYTEDQRSYYFNSLANYTLGLNFVNPQDGALTGTLQGFQDDEFVSAALHLGNHQYALARNGFGVSTLLPRTEVNDRGVASSTELVANDFPEIDFNARIIVKEIELTGQSVVVYGTHTKKRQLVLYAYDKESGTLLGTKYLGQTKPYQFGNFVATKDGGLTVLAETFLAGRFSRPCLFKLSSKEFVDFTK